MATPLPNLATPTCSFWWVTYTDRSTAFMLARDMTHDQALVQAQQDAPTGKAVATVATLPYPPRGLSSDEYPPHGFPGFCYRPSQCAGTTSCPNRRSCTD